MKSLGKAGQGSESGLFLGSSGMISRLVTEAAPCRIAVPTQSEPVSPPPMTTTWRSLALMKPSSTPSSTCFVDAVR